MNADVEKAVKSMHRNPCVLQGDLRVIEQALRDQDAEIERLRNISDGNAELYQHEVLRTEKDEALLREALSEVQSHIGYMGLHNVNDGSLEASVEVWKRITAHLGGEQ